MPCRVASTYGSFDDRVEHRVEVGHDLAAPVLRDLVDELLAEAGRAARIRRGDRPSPAPPRATGSSATTSASPQSPCGPPWIRKTTGYFFDAIEVRRLDEPVLHRRAAGAGDRATLGRLKSTSFSQASFSCVSGCRCAIRRSRRGRTSAGAVSVDFEKTANVGRAAVDAMIPPPLHDLLRRAAGETAPDTDCPCRCSSP